MWQIPPLPRGMYIISAFILLISIILYNERGMDYDMWSKVQITVENKSYEFRTNGSVVVVETGNPEITGKPEWAVLDNKTGKLVEKTFILKSTEGLVKVSPDGIVPLDPSFFYYFFKEGFIDMKRDIGLKNPSLLYMFLLPLVIGLIGHTISFNRSFNRNQTADENS